MSPPQASIMVCEDEHLIAQFIEEELSINGVTVLGPFAFVRDALGEIRERRPDGVILDMVLTDGSSAVLAFELAKAKIPFIVFCALPAHSYPTIAALAAGWFEKPMDAPDVALAMLSILQRKTCAATAVEQPAEGYAGVQPASAGDEAKVSPLRDDECASTPTGTL